MWRVCVRVYMCMYVWVGVCVRACVYGCVCVCVRLCVWGSGSGGVRV